MAPPVDNDPEFWRDFGALQARVDDLERRANARDGAAEATGQHDRADLRTSRRYAIDKAFAIATLVLTVTNILLAIWRH